MKKIISLRIFPVILLTLLLPVLATAQVIQLTGVNKSVNYKKLAVIDDVVNEYINKNWLTGAVSIVIKDNQIVQYKGYGYADVATKKPMQKDNLFRIMSQSKAITSVGIMILYEQGKLLLDEPISHFIPEYKNQTVLDTFNDADTTYRDLLTHT